MKKIILLIFVCLLMSGCYDYNELNDLAIVTGIGIDYIDQEFEVTFEILSTKKEGETSASTSSYTVSSKAKTITEAIKKNGNHLDKVAYFDHIDIVVISEEVAKNKLEEAADYLIRSAKVRNEFYMVIAKDTSAKKIIEATNKNIPSTSSYIVSLLEHNNDSYNAAYYVPFTEILSNILTDGEDAMMSCVTLNDDEITLDGLGLFKNFQLKTILNNKEASITNLLNNFNVLNVYFKKTCQNDNNYVVISIYDGNVNFDIKDNEVIVTAKLNAQINEENCSLNLKEINTYDKLEEEFTAIIKNDMNEVINKFKLYESNSLGIGKLYYDKYRKKDFWLWTKQNFIYDIDLKINKKGLTFEVD